MGYTLASPIPSLQHADNATWGVSSSGNTSMFKDSSDNVHVFAAFGGLGGEWYALYAQLTGASHYPTLIISPRSQGDARSYCYSPTYNKLYITGKYASGLTEFDVATRTPSLLSGAVYGEAADLKMGADGRVYWIADGNRLFSWNPDPEGEGWVAYDVPTSNPGTQYGYCGASISNVFLVAQKSSGKFSLYVTAIGDTDGWAEWDPTDHDPNDYSLAMGTIVNTTTPYLERQHLDGGSVEYYRINADGTIDAISQPSAENNWSHFPRYAGGWGADNDNLFYSTYGWELDQTFLLPVYSFDTLCRVGASTTQGGPYDYYSADFEDSGGTWLAMGQMAITPQAGQNVLAFTDLYGSGVSLPYKNPASEVYLGAQILSAYHSLVVPNGEVYVFGYSGKFFRYKPTAAWTLTVANSSRIADPYDPNDVSWAINPFIPEMDREPPSYFLAGDYDANGVIWITGYTIRTNPIWGDLWWYDPNNDGANGSIFPGWEAAGTPGIDVCCANNRSIICIGNTLGEIWRIDADTKAILDETPATPAGTTGKIWLKEVSYDNVFCFYWGNDGTTFKKFIFHPSDQSYETVYTQAGSLPFGISSSEINRRYWKLELGPDNNVWQFWGNNLCRYRCDLATLDLEVIKDCSDGYMLKFINNQQDVALYGSGKPDFNFIEGIFDYSTENYSRGSYASLPSDDSDLSTIYTSQDLTDVRDDDGTKVGESGTGYILHEFKEVAGPYDSKVDLHCNLQAPLAPSDYPVYLQCYDRVTVGGMWVTVATNNAAAANTDFDMDFQLNSGTTPTFSNCKDESGVISSRVYQTNVPLS